MQLLQLLVVVLAVQVVLVVLAVLGVLLVLLGPDLKVGWSQPRVQLTHFALCCCPFLSRSAAFWCSVRG